MADIEKESRETEQTKKTYNAENAISPMDNPLLDYSTYTYNISLHMLSIDYFNKLIGTNPITDTGKVNYVPRNVLISSAGRFSADKAVSVETDPTGIGQLTNLERHPYWQENFFFDEVFVRTIISPSAVSRGSNAVEGTMRIIEPNGFTFINRLVETANDVNPNGSYLYTPYMLQIDFFAMSDGEDSVGSTRNPVKLENLTKLIPIAFTGIATKVTYKGTEYKIDFVPYTHKGLSKQHNVSRIDVSVSAKTVQQLFGTNTSNDSATKALATDLNERSQREKTIRDLTNQKTALENYVNLQGGASTSDLSALEEYTNAIARLNTELKNQKFQSTGFCNAINAYLLAITKDKQDNDSPDSIEVVFDKTIGDAVLFPEGKPADSVQAAVNSLLTSAKILSAKAGKSPNTINWEAGTFNISAGTVIDKLISYAVRNSSYFLNQLSEAQQNRNKPLNWYKIIPRVELGKYRPFSRTYQTKIVYYVTPYQIYAANSPFAPNGLPTGQVKKYNYIFTGQNKDVIDLSIDFDMLYYIALPVKRNQQSTVQTADRLDPNLQKDIDGNKNSSGYDKNQYKSNFRPDSVQPVPIVHTVGTDQMSVTSGQYEDGKRQMATSVAGSDLNRNSRGDMINIKLKILGDPDFIKQDDIFYNSYFFKNKDARIFTGGSLVMDNSELTVGVNIKSPVDYNDVNGIAMPDVGRFTNNKFSGIYKITTIENTFSRGKFEQALDLVRAPIQTQEQLTNLDQSSAKEREAASREYERSVNVSTVPLTFNNVPVRSTNSAVGKIVAAAYASQQAADNQAAAAAATAAGVVGGLAAVPSLISGVTQLVTGQVIGKLVGKGVDVAFEKVGSALKDVFTTPPPDFAAEAYLTDLPAPAEIVDLSTYSDEAIFALGGDFIL